MPRRRRQLVGAVATAIALWNVPGLCTASARPELSPGGLERVAEVLEWLTALPRSGAEPRDLVSGAGSALWVLDPTRLQVHELKVVTRVFASQDEKPGLSARTVKRAVEAASVRILDLPRDLALDPSLGLPGPLVLRAADARTVWLLDGSTARLWRLQDGKWSTSRQVGEHLADVAILDATTLVAATPDHPTRAFALLDTDGVVTRRFGSRISPLAPVLGRPTNAWRLVPTGDGGLIAVHRHRALMRRYDDTGGLVWERVSDAPIVGALEHARRVAEADLESDPEGCCPGQAVVEFASFVLSFGETGYAVRYAAGTALDVFGTDGAWVGPLRFQPGGDSHEFAGGAVVEDLVVLADRQGVALFRIEDPLLAGRVVDPDGQPVADATIEVRRETGVESRVTSDAMGRFHLPVGDSQEAVQLTADAAGFLPSRHTGPLVRLLEGPLVLTPAAEVCVVATDHRTGQPVPGYALTVFRQLADASSVARGPATTHVINTPDGRACVTPNQGPPWRLEVEAEGYATYEMTMEASEEELAVELHPEAQLHVTVTRPPDEPVGGALVVVEQETDGRPSRVLADHAHALSDDHGTLTLRKLAAGEHRVLVEKPGFLPWTDTFTLEFGENSLRVELDPGAVVRARVISSRQAPVTGAEVEIRASGRLVAEAMACSTDRDGACTIRGVPAGTFEGLASAEGHGQARSRVVVPPGEELVVARFVLQDGIRLEGRVLGMDRYPDTRLQVLVTGPGTTPPRAPVSGDGRFAVNDAPVGLVDLVVLEDGTWSKLAQRSLVIVDDGSGVDRAEIELPPPVLLSGRISVGGEPCWACSVNATFLGAEAGAPDRATVAFDGHYELRLPLPGRYHLRVHDPDSTSTHAEVLDLLRDEHHDFRLGETSIRGLVIAHSGEPANGASIHVVDHIHGIAVSSTVADASGSFHLDSLAPGLVAVTACRDAACARELVDLRPGQVEELMIELPEEEALRVALVDALVGGSIQRARFLVVGSDGTLVHLGVRTASPEGVFDLPAAGVPPWTLVIDASGHALATRYGLRTDPHPQVLTVDPRPRNLTVEVDLEALTPCALQVTDAWGRPVALSGHLPPGPFSFAGPRALFGRLEPGSYVVVLVPCDGTSPTVAKPATLAPGATPVLRFP